MFFKLFKIKIRTFNTPKIKLCFIIIILLTSNFNRWLLFFPIKTLKRRSKFPWPTFYSALFLWLNLKIKQTRICQTRTESRLFTDGFTDKIQNISNFKFPSVRQSEINRRRQSLNFIFFELWTYKVSHLSSPLTVFVCFWLTCGRGADNIQRVAIRNPPGKHKTSGRRRTFVVLLARSHKHRPHKSSSESWDCT